MEEVQDQTIYLNHLYSILLELDANNAPQKSQLSHTFYDNLRFLIKLWITNIREDMPLDDLIRTANEAEVRAKIEKGIYLDEQRLKKTTLEDKPQFLR